MQLPNYKMEYQQSGKLFRENRFILDMKNEDSDDDSGKTERLMHFFNVHQNIKILSLRKATFRKKDVRAIGNKSAFSKASLVLLRGRLLRGG